MGGLAALSLLAMVTHAITVDQYPLRAGCDSSDTVLAVLRKGDPVEIRFALAGAGGACYKIAVRTPERIIEGYVAASALGGAERFEQERRAAPVVDVSVLPGGGSGPASAGISIGAGNAELGVKVSRLLESNQPREALEMLEAALKADPRDAGLLSLAGYAAYRADDLTRALAHWRESLALEPNPVVERLYHRAEREAAADTSSEKLLGLRFLLRYDRQQVGADLARHMVWVLDQEFIRVSEQLGCRAAERIVAVVQSPEAYRKATDAAEWSNGRYDGRIHVALLDDRSLGPETRRAFAHEIVHACLAELGHWPAWLHEGLAQKLTGDSLSPAQKERLRRLALAGELPKLARLSQTWSRMSARHASIAYDAALAAVELFFENYAGLGVRNLLRNPHLLPQITEDLDRRLRTP